MSGAVDLDKCLNRTVGGTCRCKPVCAVCGFGEHMAIHGPKDGEKPGSKPYGHEFAPSGIAAVRDYERSDSGG